VAVVVSFTVFVAWRRRARGPAPDEMREEFLVQPPTSLAEWAADAGGGGTEAARDDDPGAG